MRFDDLTRVEKYYSATVLPGLLAHDNFQGLKTFLELLNSKLKLKSSQVVDLTGFEENIDSIQLITEVNLERDVVFYKIDIPSNLFERKQLRTSVPDILIIFPDWVMLIEAKFFLSFSSHQLYEQMQKQTYLLDIICGLYGDEKMNKVQLSISPYGENLREFISISWQEVFDALKAVVPPCNYFLKRLENAVSRV